MSAPSLQVIPAVDVLGGRVVRLLRGSYDSVTVYDGDPVSVAGGWIGQGASLVHVVDLEAARSGEPSPRLWRSLSAAGVRFQVGGGIRTAEDAGAALDAGASRVVMGTAAVWNPRVLADVGDPDRVVAAVDVRDGRAAGAGWLEEGRQLESVLHGVAEAGIERILLTGIARDGTMEGPETRLISRAISDGRFRVIAGGGVGSLADLVTIARLGCEAAVVGRALYEGRFSLAEALAI